MLFNNTYNDPLSFYNQDEEGLNFCFVDFDKEIPLYEEKDTILKPEPSAFTQELSSALTLSHTQKKTDSDTQSQSNSLCESTPKNKSEINYNTWVDEIIQISYSTKKGEEMIEDISKDKLIRNRRKLRKREVSFLEKAFAQSPIWDKEYISKLADEIGLPYYKVYKWNWDQKKKTNSAPSTTGLGKRQREEVAQIGTFKRARNE